MVWVRGLVWIDLATDCIGDRRNFDPLQDPISGYIPSLGCMAPTRDNGVIPARIVVILQYNIEYQGSQWRLRSSYISGQTSWIYSSFTTVEGSTDFDNSDIIIVGNLIVVRMLDDLSNRQRLLVGTIFVQVMNTTTYFLTTWHTKIITLT